MTIRDLSVLLFLLLCLLMPGYLLRRLRQRRIAARRHRVPIAAGLGNLARIRLLFGLMLLLLIGDRLIHFFSRHLA